jgi:SARP family transcriptional regulator, regulator of embCAB operon
MRYELLGPLRVSNGRESHFLSAPKMEMTLAALLVRAERVTTKDQLITELWGEQPPRCASAALTRFEEALSLVRGPVLEYLAEGPVLGAFSAWVEEERLDCLEMSIEARTALGRHREVIGPLNGLIAHYPLRESFYRQLMLALYRSERQADALQVYRAAQRVLQTELGVQPCHALRRLHHAILTSDALLDLREAS